MTGFRDYVAALGVAVLGGGIAIYALAQMAHAAATVLP